MFKSKTKTCQSCKSKFTIEPEDFEFYEKIGVPAPTFCPECRLKRRLAFRNERNLYKRECNFSKNNIISIFHKDSLFKVYETSIWNSDKWDPMEYGIEYNFNKSFFKQFIGFIKKVPLESLRIAKSVNCDYCNAIIESKNCYLTSGYASENCYYIQNALIGKDCMDGHSLFKSEQLYQSMDIDNSYNLKFCRFCDNCMDSAFLYNCRNCQNCFGCVNLRHKKYHIFNKPYSKQEYFKKLKEFDLGSYDSVLKNNKKFNKFILKFPRPWAMISKSVDTTGDNVRYSKNCKNCFEIKEGAEDCKYLFFSGLALKDSHDIYVGGIKSSLSYESVGILEGQGILFSDRSHNCFNLNYCINSFNSSNLFACVGLRHKQYCILNKQYTKEEYEELVPKIKQHMNDMPYTDKKGRVYKYGEFFPSELSPFGYNETIANEYFPLTKKQAIEQGYNWYDKEKNEYEPTIKAKDLPDNIKDVNNNILKEVIQCNSKDCAGSGVFRIIPQELKFYKKMNIPLPHLCPDCRHRERIKQRNPLKLYTRQCMNKGCNNTFETTYAPDRKDIVYCEKCYNMEVG